MYLNFALNFYKTLSSADNPFKQFGPRSSPTFCADLIGVQTLWHFRGYDKLKLNQCFIFALNLYIDFVSRWYLLISVSNNLDQDQAQHSVWTWSVYKLFDTLEVMASWSWTIDITLRLTLTWHCHLLTSISNNLDPDQARDSVQIDRCQNCLTL